MSLPVVALAGSRGLPASAGGAVASVCSSVVSRGAALSVGCCVGFDALVLRWALSGSSVGSVRCFAAFGSSGAGACSLSAVSSVSSFVLAGGSVSWSAGGGSALPLRARLAARSRAVVASAVASAVACPVFASAAPGSCPGAVVFFGSPSSRGSFLAASVAAGAGLPVLAFPCGFCPTALPLLAPGGSWSACRFSGIWSFAFVWSPPPSLF